MTQYGIKLLWAGWKDDPEIGFSQQGYQQWKDEIGVGTRMLLYETSKARPNSKTKGELAIIGEVEVVRGFEKAPDRSPTDEHTYLLGVKVLRSRNSVRAIPLTAIRKLLRDENFPLQGEKYHPLDEKTYNVLLRMWT
ncbi:MAG: hypothetical protein U0670_03840 [Anaerolineae bacterium]